MPRVEEEERDKEPKYVCRHQRHNQGEEEFVLE